MRYSVEFSRMSIIQFAICILIWHATLCHASCKYATMDPSMLHQELYHIFAPKPNVSLDQKAFGTSLCKLPNPGGLSREELDQLAIQEGCLAPYNSLSANILRSSKADNISLAIAQASLRVIDLYRKRQTEKGLQDNPITAAEKKMMKCKKPQANCDPDYKYRSYDGRCNNLKNENWGQGHNAFARLLPAEYSDGLSEPRLTAKDGTALPSPRLVSSTIAQEITKEFPEISLAMTSFGQFVAHDVTQAVSFRADPSLTFDCCQAAEKGLFLAECLPIDVPADDYYYANFSVTCLSNMRTAVATHSYCDGPKPVRQQLNQINSFVDCSVVYGADDDVATGLRTFKGGRLISSKLGTPEREFPRHFSTEECDEDLAAGKICISVGDIRGAEQPLIATQQVVFVRFHNYVCDKLMETNPKWNDETLYQEARRILGAIFQRLVYGEFLPVLLGKKLMKFYDLNVVNSGYSKTYDKDVNPTTFNEFGAAAYRYGHATVPGLIKIAQSTRSYVTQRLSDHFITNYDISLVNQYINGFVNQGAELVDSGLSKEMTNNMFRKDGAFGHDLAALNINRGRDHGLPSYTTYRKECGFSSVKSFKDLRKVMDPTVVPLFQAVYTSPDDIDLFIGGIAETPIEGGIIGPTFACIIANQFSVMKKGDRFWHEIENQPFSFTEAQLREIRKITFAGILCQSSDVTSMQKYAMKKPDPESNPVYACNEFPKMNFKAWLERNRD